jgi:2-keto-4-pentenoate hydratase/2-oxohepta-3-ene-1,7-dioic acid hydratase in catechol pathway
LKLATFSTQDNPAPRVGVLREDTLVDLSICSDLPTDMKALLAAGIDTAAISSAIDGAAGLPLDSVTLNAPIPNPGKVLALGLNYGDHVAEGGLEIPEHQVWFNKQHN